MSSIRGQRGLHWIFVPSNPFGALDVNHSVSRFSTSCVFGIEEKVSHESQSNSCQHPAKDPFNYDDALLFWLLDSVALRT
jgi:hypothetical protein